MNTSAGGNLVIVGGNTAGLSAALAVRRCGDSRPITILEKGNKLGVGRCRLPYVLGETPAAVERLVYHDPQNFGAKNSLDIQMEAQVSSVDFSTKTVHYLQADVKKTVTYENLIIATGSSPLVPASFSAAAELFTASDIEELISLNNSLRTGMNVAVLGAGPIGVEFSQHLTRLGCSVTLFEKERLLRPFTENVARMVAEQLAEAGVEVLQGTAVNDVQKLAGDYRVLAEGLNREFDIVIAALGFKPQTDFIASPDLEKNTDGSIPVDRYMRTRLPSVYAIGDIAARPLAGGGKERWPMASGASIDGWTAGMNISGRRTRRELEQLRMGFVLGGKSYARIGPLPEQNELDWSQVKISFEFEGQQRDVIVRLGLDQADKVLAAETAASGNLAGILIEPLAPLLNSSAGLQDLAQLEPVYHPGMNPVNSPLAVAARQILQER